jgi:hypothetical protein
MSLGSYLKRYSLNDTYIRYYKVIIHNLSNQFKMALSQEQEIQAAFNKASIAMTELEATINKYYNTPSENIPSEQFVKVNFQVDT